MYQPIIADNELILRTRKTGDGKTLFDLVVETGDDKLCEMLIENNYYVPHSLIPNLLNENYSYEDIMRIMNNYRMIKSLRAIRERDDELIELLEKARNKEHYDISNTKYFSVIGQLLQECIDNDFTDEFIEIFEKIKVHQIINVGDKEIDLAILIINTQFNKHDYFIIDLVYYRKLRLLSYVIQNEADIYVTSKDDHTPVYFSDDLETFKIFITDGFLNTNQNLPWMGKYENPLCHYLNRRNPREYDEICAEIINNGGFKLSKYFDNSVANVIDIPTEELLDFNDDNESVETTDVSDDEDDEDNPTNIENEEFLNEHDYELPKLSRVIEYARRNNMRHTLEAIHNYLQRYNTRIRQEFTME
jgi:hypothetical protein